MWGRARSQATGHASALSPWIESGVLVLLILVKLALVADLSVIVEFSRYDDNLYVARALHLLQGEGFGHYDSVVLAKLPGMTFWLAGLRALGLPYFPVLNLLYAGAGVYLLVALGRSGLRPLVRLGVFALYLFNPLTLGAEWSRLMREPLSATLMVFGGAAMLHVLLAVAERRTAWAHVAMLAVTTAFSMLLREEDRLLWGLFILFLVACWFHSGPGRRIVPVAILAMVPVLVVASNYSARHLVESWYGLPLLHDMSEGEFPRMIAAIRGVETSKPNRLVSAPQETLAKLRQEVPRFAPVIDRLPPPAPSTHSCRLQGVCKEWSNGWIFFWIKDGAAQAGLTPTLPDAQAYFREIREGIEAACSAGRLKCRPWGTGLMAPFELRWTRAYVHALLHLGGMALLPEVTSIEKPPARFNVAVELGRQYQAVAMVDYFDSLRETSLADENGRLFRNPLAPLRVALVGPYQVTMAILLVCSIFALAYCWLVPDVPRASATLWFVTVLFVYSVLRLMALAYVSTFLGPFDSRMVLSTYVLSSFVAPLSIVEALRVRAIRKAAAIRRDGT